METREHTEVGNLLHINNNQGNPYLKFDTNGLIHIQLMRIAEKGIPEPMSLSLSPGQIVAMAGDYFTDPDWVMELRLPPCRDFNNSEELGNFLINQPILPEDENALLRAYNNLAAPDVQQSDIDKIYSIDGTNYIPFSPTLNEYFKQLMFYFRIKDYGELLNRNQSHFTPWSVRIYTLGHNMAINYTRIAYELHQLAENPDYPVQHEKIPSLLQLLQTTPELKSLELHDLAYRYHALGLALELFTFHYFSDHFAAGHMSMVGDLRVLLQQRFGTWGGILVNSLHNELNRVGVYTFRPYDPTPNNLEPPNYAGGDASFDKCLNQFNKEACIDGMQNSLHDLEKILNGAPIIPTNQFGGLEHLPDIDYNYRQPEPLILLNDNGQIFVRENLSQIHHLSPTEYANLRLDPLAHGYRELKSKWEAFKLVFQLRVLPFIYEGQLQTPTDAQLARIRSDEMERNPLREPIPEAVCIEQPTLVIPDWHQPVSPAVQQKALLQNGVFAVQTEEPKDERTHLLEPRFG